MGLSGGLRHSLERYLERSAAELDDRGAELTFRSNEIDFELERLKAVENDLREREKRVAELGPVQERLDEAMRRALKTLERAGASRSPSEPASSASERRTSSRPRPS